MHRIAQSAVSIALLAGGTWSGMAHAAPDAQAPKLSAARQMSLTTATNLATVASSLDQQHKGVVAMVEQRTNAVVETERLAAIAQSEVNREMTVYANTRGAALAAFFTAITKEGDLSADSPANLDEMEAALRAEVAAGTAVPVVATDKLQAAAKKLAALAKQQSDRERLKETATFFKDTKAATEALHAKADAAKTKSDGAAASTQSALLSPTKPQ